MCMQSSLKDRRTDRQEEEKRSRKIKELRGAKEKTNLTEESRGKKQTDVHNKKIIWDEEQDLI